MSAGSRISRVYLLRHAHSGWRVPGERDFDRPLDARGVDEAGCMATAMAVNGFLPAEVLCSPAVRCVETWRAIERKCGVHVPVHHRIELYTQNHDAYLDAIARAECPSVLVVGHNPMMEDTARALVCRQCRTFTGALAEGFPTGGLAVVDLPGPLADAACGNGELVGFLAPHDC